MLKNDRLRRITGKRNQGFSLLEVLIAIVVLSIGLLGLAGLQFSALRNNNQSYERTQAHILAYEIADAMRANRVAAGRAPTGAFELAAGTTPPNGPDCEAGTNCTQAQAAAYALEKWHERLRVLLPGGTARIECSVPCDVGARQTVFVIWDENRKGLPNGPGTATSCPIGATFDETVHLACVQVSFAP